MRKIILDEVGAAEMLISRQIKWDNPIDEAKILARYYRQVEKCDVNNTVGRLTSYMELVYPKIKKDARIWALLPVYAERGELYPLNDIKFIPIFDTELQAIKLLPKKSEQCFIFSCIAVSRYDSMRGKKSNGWISGKRWKEISERAGLNIGNEYRFRMIHSLVDNGFLELGDGIRNLSARILKTECDGEAVMRLGTPDFVNLGYCYRHYLGENFTRCEDCGIWIRQDSGAGRPNLFCKSCRKEHDKINTKGRVKEYRKRISEA